MFRAVFLSISLILVTAQTPAPALAQDTATEGTKCKKEKSTGSRILGGMLGGLASRTIGRTGVGSFIPTNLFSDVLTDAIACQLDKDEQKQAAKATDDVIQRGTVGTSSAWQSGTRKNVTGTSTVVAQNVASDGTRCMNVTDVIIVEGEETKVSKKMCRGKGQSKYTVAQV